MSRIERIATKQGHPVPQTGAPARGPFPAEIFRSLPVVEEYEGISGNGGPEIPPEGTAQNGFKAHKWFKCKLCEALVQEAELSAHICPED